MYSRKSQIKTGIRAKMDPSFLFRLSSFYYRLFPRCQNIPQFFIQTSSSIFTTNCKAQPIENDTPPKIPGASFYFTDFPVSITDFIFVWEMTPVFLFRRFLPFTQLFFGTYYCIWNSNFFVFIPFSFFTNHNTLLTLIYNVLLFFPTNINLYTILNNLHYNF